MKALFITTHTEDCVNHVRSWESVYGPAEHVTYDYRSICNDWMFPQAAEKIKPDVMFYLGAHLARGNPKKATLRELRKFAPFINICSDAADRPWHPVLTQYKAEGCFDLQVSIDGARGAPVDLAVITPVNPAPFLQTPPRDIRCGFSGTVGRHNSRSELVLPLSWFSELTVREREGENTYEDHAHFLRRCRMILNISFNGTGHGHHLKGRVLEAGYAGAALLESEGSPIGDWFPRDCYITYDGPKDAAHIIETTPDELIEHTSRRLSKVVKERYSAEIIWGSILKAANVDHPV